MDDARSFCTTRSNVGAFVPGFWRSIFARLRPAVFNRSLWQVTQYLLTVAWAWVLEKESGACSTPTRRVRALGTPGCWARGPAPPITTVVAAMTAAAMRFMLDTSLTL